MLKQKILGYQNFFYQCMPSDRNDNGKTFHGIFIRAPGIVTVDNKKDVKVLATLNTFSSEVKQTSCNGTNDVEGIFRSTFIIFKTSQRFFKHYD